MLSIVKSCAIVGLEGQIIDVEVDVSRGLPSFDIVGLPNTAIKEAKERVRTAIKNSGFEFPLGRITVNMAPADIKKEGSAYDLPIAVGILLATSQMVAEEGWFFIGELSLDGSIRPVKGTISRVLAMKSHGYDRLVVPPENYLEASLINDLEITSFNTLGQLVKGFNSGVLTKSDSIVLARASNKSNSDNLDFAEVKGQQGAKRALEIAAAGGHNVILVGPPGSGKTMLAKRLPTILPELSLDEAFEVTRVYSVSGLLKKDQPLIVTRPFRSPHHTISHVGLVGGGSTPVPGEISLAHCGILFLDEFPQYPKAAIEALREPLEEGKVTISRANGSYTFPASLTLIAGMNPCYCGFYGDSQRECTCSPAMLTRYRNKISGPIIDRMDLQVEVGRLPLEDLDQIQKGENSISIKSRVEEARKQQVERFKKDKILLNGQMGQKEMQKHCVLTKEASNLLKESYEKLQLSLRSYDRIKKVSRTIADLEGQNKVDLQHIAEALQYRCFDKTS